MSSMQYAPITGHEAEWERLGRQRKDKILIVGGSIDPLIIAEELHADAKRLLGADKVEWKLIDGAHDFPTTNSLELVREICRFWGL
jgi:surfactin synthase thioesterase subunit